MKKVKSFAKHPAIIIPVIMYVLYSGWKLVAAAGLARPVAAVLMGIMVVACTGLLVFWAFLGVKETRSRWKKKQIGSAVAAAILPMISIVTLGAAIVIPLICGVKAIPFGVLLVIATTMILTLLDGFFDIFMLYFGRYYVKDKNAGCKQNVS